MGLSPAWWFGSRVTHRAPAASFGVVPRGPYLSILASFASFAGRSHVPSSAPSPASPTSSFASPDIRLQRCPRPPTFALSAQRSSARRPPTQPQHCRTTKQPPATATAPSALPQLRSQRPPPLPPSLPSRRMVTATEQRCFRLGPNATHAPAPQLYDIGSHFTHGGFIAVLSSAISGGGRLR